jgi:hypothetical protein
MSHASVEISRCSRVSLSFEPQTRLHVCEAILLLDVAVFRSAVPCHLAQTDRRFRGAYCLHHQIMTLAVCSLERQVIRLHGATSQKTIDIILVAMRTSNLIKYCCSFVFLHVKRHRTVTFLYFDTPRSLLGWIPTETILWKQSLQPWYVKQVGVEIRSYIVLWASLLHHYMPHAM